MPEATMRYEILCKLIIYNGLRNNWLAWGGPVSLGCHWPCRTVPGRDGLLLFLCFARLWFSANRDTEISHLFPQGCAADAEKLRRL